MKKMLCLILIVAMFTSMCTVGFAYEGDFSVEREYVERFLQRINHFSTVSEPVILKNVNGELEAVCFSIDSGGYIIVNVNDLSIPELSFENSTPFKGNREFVYNGPLQYFKQENGNLISVMSDDIVSSTEFETIYTKNAIDKNKKLYDIKNTHESRAVPTEVYLSGTLKTWYKSGGLCGAIAGAIVMMFYNDNVSESYVDSSNENSNDLIDLMNEYIDTDNSGATSTSEEVDGLNAYMDDQGVNNSVYSKSSFNFTTLRSKINYDTPVIIDTDNHPVYGEHWIIAHGYFYSIVDGQYVIINNGWGQNNVWIDPDVALDDMVCFSE